MQLTIKLGIWFWGGKKQQKIKYVSEFKVFLLLIHLFILLILIIVVFNIFIQKLTVIYSIIRWFAVVIFIFDYLY